MAEGVLSSCLRSNPDIGKTRTTVYCGNPNNGHDSVFNLTVVPCKRAESGRADPTEIDA